jgi:uncharacterized membrane protein HdeD (DUF308 family)
MTGEYSFRDAVADAARYWWVFVVTGVIWLIVALVVLRFTTSSVTTIGILIGVVFTIAAITEVMVAAAVPGGWKVAHILLAVLFGVTAIWGYANPQDAFWSLASALGFVLVVYGAVELTQAIVSRDINPLWWLGVTLGILLILLGFWTSQQLLAVKAQFLVLYVGLAALFRGVSQIVFAFQLRGPGGGVAVA